MNLKIRVTHGGEVRKVRSLSQPNRGSFRLFQIRNTVYGANTHTGYYGNGFNHLVTSRHTYLSHPEGDLINLVDGHEGLHIVEQEDVVEDRGEEGQGAVKDGGGGDGSPHTAAAHTHTC